MAIHDEKYLSFTTFTKAGEEKSTAVWIADLGDGTMGFTTPGESWKVKRLRNNANVLLQPCDQKGGITPGSERVQATAQVETSAAVFGEVRSAIKAKYPIGFRLIYVINKMAGRDSDTAVIVTLK